MSARARRAHRALAALAALAFAPLCGCILASDFSGLTGGSKGTSTPDASDADLRAEEGPAFTCEGSLFCDGFESGIIAPPWTRSYVAAGAVTRTEQDLSAPSGQNVLLTSVVQQGTSSPFAYVARNFLPAPAPVAAARLSFAVYPERLDPAGKACIAGFVFGEGTASSHVIRVLVGTGGSVLEERSVGSSRISALSSTPPVGKWSRMAIVVATGNRVSVELEGKAVLEAPAYAAWGSSDALRIVLGINFADDATREGFVFRFDDVRFDGS